MAWSRDKVEDEMTLAIRLRAMAWTFSMVVFTVMVKQFVDFLFKNPQKDLTGQHVVMTMLFAYIIMYYVQKRGR